MWFQLIAAGIGIWLMAAPAALGFDEAVADAYYVLGPIAASIGAMAASAVLRELRWVNVLVGVAVAVAPLALGGGVAAIAVGMLSAAALIGLSLLGRDTTEQYGGGWRSLFA